MRAAVVGANWGRIHVRALREHGVDVVALCGDRANAGHTRQVAADLGVPVAFDDPGHVVDLPVDLITIATPAPTHPALLALFADRPIICEKPVMGMTGAAEPLAAAGERVWVNYAFAFLDSATRFGRWLDRLGGVERLDIESVHDLPGERTGPEWLLEVASHPLSFVVHRYGAPRAARGTVRGALTRLDLHVDGRPVQVTCRHAPGASGLRHRLRALTSRGWLEMEGGFTGGAPWRFEPIRLDGTVVDRGEWDARDCWYLANARSIGTVVRILRGDLDPQQGVAAGLFDLARARVIDECARSVWPVVGSEEKGSEW